MTAAIPEAPAPRPRVLVADDDRVMRKLIGRILEDAGYEVTYVADGEAAQGALALPNAPRMTVVDWMMPRVDGVELCRWLRRQSNGTEFYVVLVTARQNVEDVLVGLDAGADDFVPKPFHPRELLARLDAGRRIVTLADGLRTKIGELESALGEVRTLRGLIPICMHCHRIRSDSEQWTRMEAYIESNSDAQFSHSVCDSCLDAHYPKGDA